MAHNFVSNKQRKAVMARIRKMGFDPQKVHTTKKHYRFRLEDPLKFVKFRTLDVGKKGDIKLIVGITKKEGKRGGRTRVQSVLVER